MDELKTPDSGPTAFLKMSIRFAGSQEKLAKAVGVTQQAVSQWVRTRVDADSVIKVCQAVDFQVSPHQLRPDLYPHPDDGLPEAMREQARAAE